jgi:hypothetical protein
MTCRRSHILVLISALGLLISGCRKSTVTYVPSSTTLTVNVVGRDVDCPDLWIVVGNTLGTAVLTAQRVTGEGVVDFGDLGTDPISVSIVHKDRQGNGFIDTYLNTRGGAWTFVRGPQEPIGVARVTLHYPPGGYLQYKIQLPYGACATDLAYTLGDTVTRLTANVDLYRLEPNNVVSILAELWSADVRRRGWLVAQPFQYGEDNSYFVEMDQPAPARTFTSSRPLTDLWLDAYRGSPCSRYSLSETNIDMPGGTSIDLPVPAFPADRWRLSGLGTGTYDQYYLECLGSPMPTELVVPTSRIGGVCNPSGPFVEGLTVSGQADAVWVWFGFLGSNLSCDWTVTAPNGTSVISLPSVPDSIRLELGADSMPLWAVGIEMDDYDTAYDYESYLDIVCRAERGTQECLYNRLFWDYDCIYVDKLLAPTITPQPPSHMP